MDEKSIIEGIISLIRKAETELPQDVIIALKKAYDVETGIAKTQIDTILKNVELAKTSKRPMCQDTGIQTFFVQVGINFPKINDLEGWITKGVKRATKEIPLRPNTVDPFSGKNHGDNVGENIPYITWEFMDGDKILITALPKGGGSENMSKIAMLKPADGIEGAKKAILEIVDMAGGNACPPMVIGVGIGGTFEKAAFLAKKALLRPIGNHSDKKYVKEMEEELLDKINKLGIGPQGLGGTTTALAVNIETFPTHIAGLPVAVNISCHVTRHITKII